MGGTETTSTMKDSFANQMYYVNNDPKIQIKHKKDTIIFGHDKSDYFKARNSRTSTQDLSNISRETKQIADSVKQKLNMHNFKFGSYLPEYTSTSITGDKLILSPDAKDEAMKQQSASDIKKRMASTQNSWTKMNALKSFDSQITKSRGKLDIRDNSEAKELNHNNALVPQPKRLIPVSKSPIVFQEKIDPNNLSSLSNSFKNKPKLFWDVNRASFGKTQTCKTGTQSPFTKKHNINEGYIQLGENQKTKVSGTTTTESFRPGVVSVNDREKDKEVHDFMKKKNVHLGSFNNDPNVTRRNYPPLSPQEGG